ncbi:Uncharacterised protein [Escherichia coli]|nr:hypothetical protein [Escherichia coli]EFO1446604.1 hypothetical protein [Escherichia coli]RBJ26585.1 hypothetical protein DSB62_08660 [Escherichia coli]GCU86969.1 hypothetical protein HmCmsJML044_00817 [Escherichia coli]STL16373.1 Uncharacterised protein [Escherichia coli]
MQNTISNGFHRLGILLATLVFIFGLLFSPTDTQGFSLLDILTSLTCALLIYAVLRFVGWVVNGFIKNS